MFLCVTVNSYGAVLFDGVDDSIAITSTAALRPVNITIACWSKPESGAASEYMLAGQQDGAATNWQLRVGDSSLIDARFLIWVSGSIHEVVSGTTQSAGTWYHTAGTYDGENLRIYLDGVLKNTNTTPSGNLDQDTAVMSIGALADRSQPFEGDITDCAEWNTDLTGPEIALLASSRVKRMPLQIQPSALVGYWSLDQVAEGVEADALGAIFLDLSGNGHDGDADNGGNNTGMTGTPERILTYQ